MPVSSCKAFQKHEMKSLLQSETMSSGNPFLQYHFSKNISANCSAVNAAVVGINWMSEPKRSVIVRMVSKPSSSGSGPMKSITTELQHFSGMGSGCKGPMGFCYVTVGTFTRRG